MTAFAGILISLAAALLRVLLQQRQAANDAHAVGRLEGSLASLEQAKQALAWKVEASRDPAHADDLRVRDNTHELDLQGPDSGPDVRT